MPETVPVRENNAIDEIAFVLQFKEFFSGKELVKELINLHTELEESLPSYDITNSFMFQVGAQPIENVRPDKQIGVVCYKLSDKDPNRHEWALRVDANKIIVTCSEYTNWDEVSKRAVRYLRAALFKVNLEDNPVVEIGYQCVDKFICPDENFSFGDLFENEPEYLTPHIVQNTPEAWHVHQGWFEKLTSVTAARMLHNLNINMHHKQHIENGVPTEDRHREAIVSHLIRIQNVKSFEKGSDENLVGKKAVEANYLTAVLNEAHDSNKKVIKKLLCKDMRQKIGLQDV